LIATEQDADARARWRTEVEAVVPETLVFLDETSTQTVMTRRTGRAPGGQRVVGHVPRNHGPNVTCLVAIGPDGLHAPCVFEGALDGALFVRWVSDWLVPTLRPGMTVVLDNLSVHKTPAARAAIEGAGCQLRFLPAYSPDFNPIEFMFAKLKTYLRGVAARTFEPLLAAIGDGLARGTPADIAGYYRHCGYPLMSGNAPN
jgi:transposase